MIFDIFWKTRYDSSVITGMGTLPDGDPFHSYLPHIYLGVDAVNAASIASLEDALCEMDMGGGMNG